MTLARNCSDSFPKPFFVFFLRFVDISFSGAADLAAAGVFSLPTLRTGVAVARSAGGMSFLEVGKSAIDGSDRAESKPPDDRSVSQPTDLSDNRPRESLLILKLSCALSLWPRRAAPSPPSLCRLPPAPVHQNSKPLKPDLSCGRVPDSTGPPDAHGQRRCTYTSCTESVCAQQKQERTDKVLGEVERYEVHLASKPCGIVLAVNRRAAGA